MIINQRFIKKVILNFEPVQIIGSNPFASTKARKAVKTNDLHQ